MTREMMENVARELGNAEVTTVKKNGVDKVAIQVKKGNVGAILYAESFEDCSTVEEAVAKAGAIMGANKDNMERITGIISFFEDYNNVKENLTVRLLSGADDADVFRSAKRIGFDGLKIVPYVNVPAEFIGESGAIKVKKEHLKHWGVTAKEVIDTAIKNAEKDTETQSLFGFVAELTGIDDGLVDLPDGPIIVTNKAKCFGAAAILGLIPSLKKKYKEGFFVIPSSVHEVLVMPKGFNGFDLEGMTQLVQQVNATEVMAEERLADHAFAF